MGEVERSSAEGERLGVAAAGLQVCPRAPAAATRRLPPAPMRSISGSVRWDSGETYPVQSSLWCNHRAI